MKRKIISSSIKENKHLTIITMLSIGISSTLIFVTLMVFSSLRNTLISEVKDNIGDYHVIVNRTYIKDTSKIDKIEIKNNKSYITFTNPSKAYKYGEKICEENCTYNKALLSLYGISPNNFLIKIIFVILSIISLFSFIVIKNIFDIQNKLNLKRYSILNSLGMTKGEIIKISFLESLIISLISVLISFGFSVFITKLLLNVLNNKLQVITISFDIYISFLLIGLLFILSVIICAKVLPLLKLSRKNLIKNIEGNFKNIKLKYKKQILNLLGVEGLMAYISYRRNKKRYKVITRCIWISLSLFISFYLIFTYSEKAIDKYVTKPNYDGEIIVNGMYDFKDLLKKNNINDYMSFEMCLYKTKIDKKSYINKDNYHDLINVMVVNYDKGNTFVLNRINENILRNEKLIHYNEKLFSKNINVNLDEKTIENIKLNERIPSYLENYTTSNNVVINVQDFDCEKSSVLLYKGKIDTSKIEANFEYFDAKKSLKIIGAICFGIKILMFSFMIFILLLVFTGIISISVSNLNIRKNEIGILKSFGFTDFNFFKMLFFESIFVCFSAFVISIVLIMLISSFIYYSVNLVMNLGNINIYFYFFKFLIYALFLVFLSLLFSFYFVNQKTIITNQN